MVIWHSLNSILNWISERAIYSNCFIPHPFPLISPLALYHPLSLLIPSWNSRDHVQSRIYAYVGCLHAFWSILPTQTAIENDSLNVHGTEFSLWIIIADELTFISYKDNSSDICNAFEKCSFIKGYLCSWRISKNFVLRLYFSEHDNLKCEAIHFNDAVTHIFKHYFEYMFVYLRMQFTET